MQNNKKTFVYGCGAVSWAELYSGALGFFVSSSDALSFYICSHLKAENVKFSEWLPLANCFCARDVISHSLAKVFCVIRFWS